MGAPVLGKAKNDCSWGWGDPGGCPGGGKVLFFFFFFKHANALIVRVNMENISSVVTLNNVMYTYIF